MTAPAARGGCQVALHGTLLFVIGGHTAWKEGKQEQEKVHDDVWALDLQTWQVLFHWLLPSPAPPTPPSPPHPLVPFWLLQLSCTVFVLSCILVPLTRPLQLSCLLLQPPCTSVALDRMSVRLDASR